jgi:hypothetical protein
MRYGIFILALGVLWSSQVSAGELQSVYVAPGVMCHRGRYTEHRHFMKDTDQSTRRPRPQSTPTVMRKNFRRGRLPLCHTTALRVVYSTQLMVGRDTVTNTCYDKGRFREPSFAVPLIQTRSLRSSRTMTKAWSSLKPISPLVI